MRVQGFPPLAAPDARVLVLGSLPSNRSIAAQRYYAHPRNVFWHIMGDLFGVPREAGYAAQVECLARMGVAVWDVLQSSRRQGSLDAAIEPDTARVNDFAGFFAAQPRISLVCFNGRKAAAIFRRRVAPGFEQPLPELCTLPSTSPAHAAMPYDEKLRRWSLVRDVLWN